MEKPRRHYLTKQSRLTSPVWRQLSSMCPLISGPEKGPSPVWYSCQKCTSSGLSWSNMINPNWGTVHKTTGQHSSKVSQLLKTKKVWGTITDYTGLRKHDNQIQHGILEQQKKMTLVEKNSEIQMKSVVWLILKKRKTISSLKAVKKEARNRITISLQSLSA